jgi:proteasome accessory factor B
VAGKSERLLNLVVLLMRGSWVRRSDLRRVVPEYRDAASEEAFQRMFERDKAELRDLGIPIETGPDDAQGDELGYRVRTGDYQLPEIAVDDDDLTVLALAARAWQDAAIAGDARQGAAKLAAGAGGSASVVPEVDVRLPEAGAWFPVALAAVRERAAISFDYRNATAVTTRRRTVEPWVLTARAGAWYIVGHDVERAEPRAFRTSRIHSDVVRTGLAGGFERPPHATLEEQVAALVQPATHLEAKVAAAPGRAQALRRRARTVEPAQTAHGWDLLTLDVGDERALAADIAATGGGAAAVSPPSLVAAVRDDLAAVLAAHEAKA